MGAERRSVALLACDEGALHLRDGPASCPRGSRGTAASGSRASSGTQATEKERVEELVQLGAAETRARQGFAAVEITVRRFLAAAEKAQRPAYQPQVVQETVEKSKWSQYMKTMRQQKLEQRDERRRQEVVYLTDRQLALREVLCLEEADERSKLQLLTLLTALAIEEREARAAIVQEGMRGLTALVLKARRYVAHTRHVDAAVGDPQTHHCRNCGEAFAACDARFHCTVTGIPHAASLPCPDCGIVCSGPHTAFCPATGKRHDTYKGQVAQAGRWPWEHGGASYTKPSYRRREVTAGAFVQEATYVYLYNYVVDVVDAAEEETLYQMAEAEAAAAAAAAAATEVGGSASPSDESDAPSVARSVNSRISRAMSRMSRAKSALSKKKASSRGKGKLTKEREKNAAGHDDDARSAARSKKSLRSMKSLGVEKNDPSKQIDSG
eukprot:TRINITY_DN6096_c1_g1_i3.p1 TRINITY_DN6096_c1_g1~~TRINITY_DN6096_c1_g1_i3.p1  ORF type:complete len:461 (+),score=176.98 TRINITY_DN6096_c1_g1_i3:65-1384(+)